VGEEARLALTSEGPSQVRIDAYAGDSIVARIEFDWKQADQRLCADVDPRYPERSEPRELAADHLAGASGMVGLRLKAEAAATLFPNLTRCVSPLQIAVLLATSRLVGVECPGLHSLFYELSLVAADDTDRREPMIMKYEVTRLDRRFGFLLMKVTTPGMTGVIRAFLRPQPTEQATYLELKKFVNDGEFADQRALIIGGSRGLGEVTAKLLAAGGARVQISYHQGQAEAQRIVQDIVSNGGQARHLHVDVLSSQQNPLAESVDQEEPSHLYYFATPFIFSGSKGVFSMRLFQQFCDYYLAGFVNVMNSLKASGMRKVFYPSTIAVERLPADMGEYAAAKAAAETLCSCMEKNMKGLAIYRPRLPRMGTDQTASVLPVDNRDPAPIMLQHLRVFRDA
jgi:hypothetical protein